MITTVYDLLVDATGEDCPMPTVHAKNALDTLSAGQILKLIASTEGTIKNIRTFVANHPYELMSETKFNETFIFFIKKL